MVGFGALWLPVFLSAVIVFVVSSIIHMFTPWHKNDYRRMGKESEFLDALRALAIPPGDYMGPMPADMKEMRSPEFAEKLKKGPMFVTTVIPGGGTGMAKSLTLWFVYLFVVGLLAGYVARITLPAGAEYRLVFRVVSTAAFIGYSVSIWQMSIWYHRSWVTTLKSTIDGLLYALLTAGTFGWLWPR